jgi:hypothetical protein
VAHIRQDKTRQEWQAFEDMEVQRVRELLAQIDALKLENASLQASIAPKPRVRAVMGTMTMGPGVGDAHMDGKHSTLPSWCQTPPDVAAAQLAAFASCPDAMIVGGPEDGKVLLDTASAYQNWTTEGFYICKTDPE